MLESLLKQHNQEHLVSYANGSSELAEQLEKVDLPQLKAILEKAGTSTDWRSLAAKANAPTSFRQGGGDEQTITATAARATGEEALRAGRLAMILVAGGQGTRLGFDHPKGMFPIGPVSERTLFQFLIEHLRAVAKEYETRIPLFLMTSPATHEETIEFLNEHDRFGLAEDDLHIFCQGVMPAVDAKTGKLLLASADSLALSPDGHGGMLAALHLSGGLELAKERGIDQFFYGQVDNPLLQVCDPELIGYHLLAESEMTLQVIEKCDPLERVGNVVDIDGQLQIIEYSDLPDEFAAGTNDAGEPIFWAGSIAVHLFNRDFLERMNSQADALPFHLANKAVPHLDDANKLVEPTEPNATKFERFIFDLLPSAKNAIVVAGKREECFAPVKNAPGAASDTAATSKAAIVALHRAWLEEMGMNVQGDIAVEVSPWLSVGRDKLKDISHSNCKAEVVDQPTYFDAES